MDTSFKSGRHRKATPEEIIKHFNQSTTKTTNIVCTNSNKKIIGRKLIKSEYKQAALGICPNSDYLKTGTSSRGLPYIMENSFTHDELRKAGVIDLWFEPVYENYGVKIGGYAAVKEGENIAFGCQKFDLPELCAYKKLLAGYNENKAEITVAGTKITIELLDRLISLL